MVCWEKIKQMEKELGRKLTKKEKEKVEKLMHHNEIHHEHKDEEVNCLCQ
jgi:predicted metal-binding protein